MTNHGKYRAMPAENIYIFLRDDVNRWVQCQYCGRTLQFSQLMSHWRNFHNYDRGLIIDYD